MTELRMGCDVECVQVSYCGATGEQDVLCINERQVMVRSKGMYDQQPPNTSLEGVQSDLLKRYASFNFILFLDLIAFVVISTMLHCFFLFVQTNDCSSLCKVKVLAFLNTLVGWYCNCLFCTCDFIL